MAVPIRELANTSLSTSNKALSTNLIAQIPANIDIDINVNILRGRSASPFSKSLRESSIYLNVFSVPYYTRIKI